jgi:diguanylate cyclase (GGDEF)-like protein/PAS domain S-box-containing protein
MRRRSRCGWFPGRPQQFLVNFMDDEADGGTMSSWPPDLAGRVALLNDLPTAAMLVQQGRVVAANADAERLVGVPRKGGGLPVGELFRRDDRRVVDQVVGLDADEADGAGVWRAVARPAHGRERWVEVSLRTSSAGGPQVVLLREVTDEVRHQAIVELVADATFAVDATGGLTWRSPGLAERWRAPDEATATNPVDRIHPEDLPIVLDAFSRLVTSPGANTRLVARAQAFDTENVWETVELTFHNCLDDGYVNGVVVQVLNLEEGRRIQSLSRADGEYVSLAEAAPVGIIVGDPMGRIVYSNGVAGRMVGDGVFSLGKGGLLRLISAEHRDEAAVAVSAALRAGIESTLTVLWTPAPAGARPCWLRLHVAPQLTTADRPVGVIITFEDVTDQVEARAEAERLKRMLEASPDFVVVFRPDPWELLFANRVMRDLLAVPLPSGEQRRFRHFLDDRGRERFLPDARSQSGSSDVFRGDTFVNHPTRGELPVSALLVVQRDEHGAIDTMAFIARDITDLKEAQDRLLYVANHDTLTGLANRALFTQHLELALRRHPRNLKGLAVMFCDLNGFKAVNDRLGHVAGDAVLSEVGRRLAASVRGADLLARFGGDEFVLLCEECGESEDGLYEVAVRLQLALERPVRVGGEDLQLGLSVGVAVAGADSVPPPDELLTLADHAMYEAKATGSSIPTPVVVWAKHPHYEDLDGEALPLD